MPAYSSSLPMFPSPQTGAGARHSQGSLDAHSQFHTMGMDSNHIKQRTRENTPMGSNASADKEKAHEETSHDMCRSIPSRLGRVATVFTWLICLLGCGVLLVLFGLASAQCSKQKLDSSDTSYLSEVNGAVCEMASSTRYWMLTTLAFNSLLFIITLPTITPDFCQLKLNVNGSQWIVLCLFSATHMITTCLLVGLLYTQGLSTRHLQVLHTASVMVLLSTLVIAVSIAATIFIHSHSQPAILPHSSSKISRSRRNSSLEGKTPTIQTSMSDQSTHTSSTNQHSTSPHIRDRFANSSMCPSIPLPSPIPARKELLADVGMSLAEIKQIASHIVPCCSPRSSIDQAGNVTRHPCCPQAPVLPPTVTALGLTSPRIQDHGPVADLTDSTLGVTVKQTGPMISPGAGYQLNIPKHLHLITTTPSSSSAVYYDPEGQGQLLRLPFDSPLYTLLTRGPSAVDVECQLCHDLFQSHQTLKILPNCLHAFHTTCLIPYLKHRRDCPKRDCHAIILNDTNNRYGDFSKLGMVTPPQSSMNLKPLPTPDSVRIDKISPSSASQPPPLNVITSPPYSAYVGGVDSSLHGDGFFAHADVDLEQNIGTCSGAVEYKLDSVRLTPANQHR